MEEPKIIKLVGEYLRKTNTRSDALKLDTLRFELALARVDAQKLLYEKRKQMLWPKDAEKGLTELDRTTRLNADVAVLERNYQFLARLEELVDNRIDLVLRR